MVNIELQYWCNKSINIHLSCFNYVHCCAIIDQHITITLKKNEATLVMYPLICLLDRLILQVVNFNPAVSCSCVGRVFPCEIILKSCLPRLRKTVGDGFVRWTELSLTEKPIVTQASHETGKPSLFSSLKLNDGFIQMKIHSLQFTCML